ncbi:MAG TPA: 5-formyltetrahydrofolate cyclo-ligase [Casimicrobiaceae bacterium]|nr:5-formyltetrahydrofolate cyclo-ligase [Casimicrobiaceae bacterium]
MDPKAPATPASPTGAALRDAKRDMRLQALAARDALPPEARAAASERIAAAIAALPSFAAARTLLVTLPFRSEWDTRLVIAHALRAGKTVVSPRVDPTARMLTLHRIEDLVRDVAPGYRTIPEPLAHCPVVTTADIDWVLVPGVAFDAAGRRLGYGGGYYDRLLPLLPARAPRIAGALEAQMVAAVPFGPHDLCVDAIVTEARIVASPDTTRR